MPRAIPRAWGTLLAMAVFAAASVAGGQAPAPPAQGKPMPGKQAPAPGSSVLSPAQQRLEEMKVELALLGDIDTFPYSLGTTYRGGALDLYGFVPDDMARQNVLEVARRTTTLTVNDGLGIRADPAVQSAVRPADALQKDGAELLQNHLHEKANKIAMHVRPDSVVILTGSIDSVERKLQVSRMFRQLSGCAGVDNLLVVEPIVRDGKTVVQVTRDGTLFLPTSEASSPSASLASSAPSPAKIKQVNFAEKVGTAAAPTPLPMPSVVPPEIPLPAASPSMSATPKPTVPVQHKAEAVHSIPATAPKQPDTQPKPVPSGGSSPATTIAAPKLPVKWGRPSESWETQASQLEPRYAKPQAMPPTAPVMIPKRNFWMAEPVDVIGALKRLHSQVKARRMEETNPQGNQAPTNRVETRNVRPPALAGNRLGGEEHSEPISPAATKETNKPLKPLTDRMKVGPPLRSPRPWPPAYVYGPPVKREPSAERQEASMAEMEPRFELSEEQHADKLAGTELRSGPSERPQGGIAMATPTRTEASHERHDIHVPEASANKALTQERHGTIILSEDPLTTPKTPSPFASTRPIGARELQQQLKALCGRQAGEVSVMVHIDGSLLVRVKVPNRTVEDQLSRKILSLPEVQSPRVRLLMEVEP